MAPFSSARPAPLYAHPAALLVVATGSFLPSRGSGMVVPAGARLLVPVPLSAATPRAAVARGMAAAGDGATGDAALAGEDKLYKFMQAQGISALALLTEIVPPPSLLDKAYKLNMKIAAVLASVKEGNPENKMACATQMVRLACEAYPVAGLPQMPKEDSFVALCFGTGGVNKEEEIAASPLFGTGNFMVDFGPDVDGKDVDAMRAVVRAMNMATCAVKNATAIFFTCGGDRVV